MSRRWPTSETGFSGSFLNPTPAVSVDVETLQRDFPFFSVLCLECGARCEDTPWNRVPLHARLRLLGRCALLPQGHGWFGLSLTRC